METEGRLHHLLGESRDAFVVPPYFAPGVRLV